MPEFAYKLLADGTVRISHRDRHVVTLAGTKAATFRTRAEGAGEDDLQLLMARMTGNFKRGNERVARERSRRA